MVNNTEQHPITRFQTMFTKFLRPATKLDKAITASVAAMLAMNFFVLAQQLQAAPAFADNGTAAAQQV